MRTMNPVMATGALVALWGCGGKGPSGPSAPSSLAGNYTLVVDASSVCRLSVSRFQWDVEGTAAGGAVRATLPGGNSTVDVSISYAPNSRVTGSITTRLAPQEDQVRVSISGTARGTLSAIPGGRGQVSDGNLNGSIAVRRPGERPPEIVVESCTAADHQWSLVPR